MAEYSERVVVTTRWEWAVPTDGLWGACWVEVHKAVRAAHQKLWDLSLVPEGKDAHDDQIRIHVGDEEIIVAVVLEKIEGSTSDYRVR